MREVHTVHHPQIMLVVQVHKLLTINSLPTHTSPPQFTKRNQLMVFLDKWKWLNFQEVKH